MYTSTDQLQCQRRLKQTRMQVLNHGNKKGDMPRLVRSWLMCVVNSV